MTVCLRKQLIRCTILVLLPLLSIHNLIRRHPLLVSLSYSSITYPHSVVVGTSPSNSSHTTTRPTYASYRNKLAEQAPTVNTNYYRLSLPTPHRHQHSHGTNTTNTTTTTSSRSSPFSFPYTIERSLAVNKAVHKNMARYSAACQGKQRLLEILHAANFHEINDGICAALPTWEEVIQLYGEDPVIYGMETCATFRAAMAAAQRKQQQQQQGKESTTNILIEPIIGVSGVFNSGTNAFAQSLQRNLRLNDKDDDPRRRTGHAAASKPVPVAASSSIPWDKHVPEQYKWNSTYAHINSNHTFILPIVLIRDPYWWMVSMCKESYSAAWRKTPNCPNLLHTIRGRPPAPNAIPNMVRATYQTKFRETYHTLADMWNDWYVPYLNATYPRLIIRFEDQLFHAEKVMALISECTGIPLKSSPYQYQLQRSKDHGNPANFVSALIKYAAPSQRYKYVFNEDLRYAHRTLHSELMRVFQYRHVPTHADDDKLAIQRSFASMVSPDRDDPKILTLGRWSFEKDDEANRRGRVAPHLKQNLHKDDVARLQRAIERARQRQQSAAAADHRANTVATSQREKPTNSTRTQGHSAALVSNATALRPQQQINKSAIVRNATLQAWQLPSNDLGQSYASPLKDKPPVNRNQPGLNNNNINSRGRGRGAGTRPLSVTELAHVPSFHAKRQAELATKAQYRGDTSRQVLH